MTLGERLRKLRGERMQKEIADELGISRARYSHYERDHVQPDHELLYKMADVYGVSIDHLLGRMAAAQGISKDEALIIESLRQLSDEDLHYIRSLINRLTK